MKKILLAGMLLLVLQVAGAQKIYFIYIQSEGNTPFFVKMGDKVSSSTASGYLILPKLVDSVYQFSIGKTGQTEIESRFSVTINKKDKGFLLRETQGKFNLFDLQELTLVGPLAATTTSNEIIGQRTDAFAVLLSQAANDPSLLEIRAATATPQPESTKPPEPVSAVAITPKMEQDIETKPEEKGPDTTSVVEDVATTATPQETETTNPETIAPDTTSQVIAESKIQSTTVAEEPAADEPESKPYIPSIVTRKSESSTTEGFGLVFWDESEGVVDTIRILIPNQPLAFSKEEAPENAEEKKFLNITNIDTTKTDVKVEEANEKLTAAKERRKCAVSANQKDFLKLRKNMVAEDSDDDMIDEAKKVFRKTCFSTEQIKNLSSLFLSASGKYHFFDAAYGHVSDPEQYSVLQTELQDDYYVNRFKALTAKQ